MLIHYIERNLRESDFKLRTLTGERLNQQQGHSQCLADILEAFSDATRIMQGK